MRLNPFNNLTLKIGAVVLALLLWIHVATNKSYEYQVEMNLRVANVPRSLVLVSNPPTKVIVRIKTTGKQLIALLAQHHTVTIDASEYHEGTFDRDLVRSDADAALKENYEDVGIVFPRKLFLRFEKNIDRTLLVESRIKATTAQGFGIVGKPKIAPEMVQVSGPASFIRGLKSIETEGIAFSDMTETSSYKVRLTVPDSSFASLRDSMVTVTFTVERVEERLISSVPVTPPADFDVENFTFVPAQVSLRVGIPLSMTKSFSADRIRVSFASLDMYVDSTKSPLKYSLPSNVGLVGTPLDSVLILRRR